MISAAHKLRYSKTPTNPAASSGAPVLQRADYVTQKVNLFSFSFLQLLFS